MPAVITHYLHAERVLDRLEDEKPKKKYDRDAFLWGAQGPDVFFCHRIFPWQRGGSLQKYGGRLHKEAPSKILEAMRAYLKSTSQKKLVSSYISGFLCHYSLDRTSHPFVRFESEELYRLHPEQSVQIFHHEVESALDVIMMRREKSELASEFDLKNGFPKNSGVQDAIAGLYVYLLEELYGKKYSKEQLIQVTGDARKGFGLLNDKTGLKKQLLERIERHGKRGNILSCHFRGLLEDGEYDYANIDLNIWFDGDEERSEDYFAVFDRAVEDAVRLVTGFHRGDTLSVLTEDRPF